MLRLRLAPIDDEAALYRVYRDVRREELGVSGGDAECDRLLAFQFEAHRRGYRGQFPAADRRLILSDEQPIGWIVVDRSAAEIHCIDIALVARARGRGTGSALLRALQREAATVQKPVTLVARRTNLGALALYRRLGFRVVAETDLLARMEWRPNADAAAESA
jgi:ribosomal protein S18 acetylase RimI-like enzyme